MKATCPSCASTYRVADEKIPEVGAQIKCPKCNTLFVVRKPLPASVPPPVAPSKTPTHEQATAVQDLVGGQALPPKPPPPSIGVPSIGVPSIGTYSKQTAEKTVPASQTPYQDGLQGQAEVAAKPAGIPEFDSAGQPLNTDPRGQAKGISAIRAQSSVRQKTPKVKPDSYRVRTAKGLAYDFSDRESMIRWLRDRESIEGCEVAEPGEGWKRADQFLSAGPATGSMPVVLDEEQAYVPEPGEELPGGLTVGGEEQARPGGALPLAMWAVAGLSALVLLYALGATLTRFGVVNLSSVLPVSWVGVEFPGEEASEGSGEAPGEVIKEDPQKAYQKALDLAKRAIRSKHYSRAALEYNRALTVRPDSIQALEGLARAYNGLGDRERALAVLKKAKAQANKEPPPGERAPKEKG